MSDTVASFDITVPAGSVNQSPTDTPLGDSDVQDIIVVVPPGPAGNLGFQIWAGGSPAYPSESSQFFVFDDYTLVQEVSNQITTGQWAIAAYNNDTFDHTIRVYYRFNYLRGSPSPSLGSPVGL